MRSSNRTNILIAIAVLALSSIFWAGCTGNGDGTSSNEPISAVLDEITGRVQTLNPSEGKFINAFDGQGIDINYQVLTHSDSRARLSLSNGTIIRLSPFLLSY